MAVNKTATEIITEASLAASATTALADCTAVDCTKATQLVFVFVGTFNASATDGATITLWPSYDGTNYDTSGWNSWTWGIAVDAGNTVREHSLAISPVPKYMKIKVTNADSSYTITALKVFAIKQTAG